MHDDQVDTTVIICSKDRPDGACRVVHSLLADESPMTKIVLVDQSSGRDTEQALAGFCDRRLTYVRSTSVGKGAALNEGLELVTTEFVAFTDDDCEATTTWLREIVRPMQERPAVGLVFSNVVPPEHDSDLGYVPQFVRSEDQEIRSVLALRKGWGLGAGMAARLDAVRAMGGADEFLGPGARFPSADDLDFEIRFLLAGWHVYEASHASIVHHGFRTWQEGRDHAVRDWLGIGGCIAKSARTFHLSAVFVGLVIVTKLAVLPALGDLVRLRRPRLRRILAFGTSFANGLVLPVDNHTLKYGAPPHASSTSTRE